jgi:plastocyanin
MRIALLPLAFLLAAMAPATAPKTHTIVIDKMKFGPIPARVRVGDTILWVNRDLFKHTATARDGSFNVDLVRGASGRTLVGKAGTFPFYCIYHPGMKGSLVVAK